MPTALAITPAPEVRLSLQDKRLLAIIGQWKADGKPGLPGATDCLRMGRRFFSNRGATSTGLRRLEALGLTRRTHREWTTGALTRKGAQLVAHYHARLDALPSRKTTKRSHPWSPELGMRTLHPSLVRDPGNETVLKSGRNVSKLGGTVTKGRLENARIRYLTLEERKTCPSTCPALSICYGDSMSLAIRYNPGPELEVRIDRELRAFFGYSRHLQLLVRLHELGDFYSPAYVRLWGRWLKQYPRLHIFGFTAREKYSDIGREIEKLKDTYGHRFAIRWSGRAGPWGAVIVKRGTTTPGTFTCPEQTRRVASCSACGACWSTEKTVAFIEH